MITDCMSIIPEKPPLAQTFGTGPWGIGVWPSRQRGSLTCSCFCGYNCKHEFAAMLQLRETLELIQKHYADQYERTGYFAAVNKGTLFSFAVDGRETGSFTL